VSLSTLPDQDSGLRVTAEELIGLRHRARNLVFRSKRPVSSVIAGVHVSRFRGRGVDFLESRNYIVGDDIRNLDWKVTARTGKPHTKVFQEERERPVITLLDLNPSMYFGTRTRLKVVQAARLAATIGWATTRRGDRIGGLIYSGDAHHEVRPAGGRRGALRFISLITRWAENYTPVDFTHHSEGLSEALKRLRRIARPGSLVFLISDFYAADDQCERHLAYLRKHNDVIACQVLDAIEKEPPPPADYPVSDGIHSGLLDLSGLGRKRFVQFFQQQHELVNDMLRQQGIARITVQGEDDAAEALARLFKRREVA
jgi:uncharacterized protein (DUF58 family)